MDDVPANAASSRGREIEIKLLAGPGELARLRRSPLLSRFAEGRPVTRRLLSVYYDTPDLALRRKGLALRVRNKGAAYIQTVKTKDTSGPASNREESESLLADDRPDPNLIADPALRRMVTKLSARHGLHPVYETDIRRTERQLLMPGGDRIELAVDTGVIRAHGREESVSELELELKSGNPAALFRLACSIAEEFDVRLGVLSKAARGYALASGESGIVPVKAGPPALDVSMTVDEAVRAVVRTCLAQIVGNEPAVVTAVDPEGIHQMRVGLRRLRSASGLFSDAGFDPWLGPLAEEARWFAAKLGRARDLDVFIDEMLRPVEEGISGQAGLARLRTAAETRREAAWAHARSAVASRRFACFVLSVAAIAEERPWQQQPCAPGQPCPSSPVRSYACRVLRDRHAGVRSKALAFDELREKERHALRIELKKLRYSADFLGGLFPKKAVKPILKSLSRLQDTFGYLNDAAVAGRLARRLSKRTDEAKKGSLREAAGIVAGWHGHRSVQEWKRAKKRWRAFEKLAPFWQDER